MVIGSRDNNNRLPWSFPIGRDLTTRIRSEILYYESCKRLYMAGIWSLLSLIIIFIYLIVWLVCGKKKEKNAILPLKWPCERLKWPWKVTKSCHLTRIAHPVIIAGCEHTATESPAMTGWNCYTYWIIIYLEVSCFVFLCSVGKWKYRHFNP